MQEEKKIVNKGTLEKESFFLCANSEVNEESKHNDYDKKEQRNYNQILQQINELKTEYEAMKNFTMEQFFIIKTRYHIVLVGDDLKNNDCGYKDVIRGLEDKVKYLQEENDSKNIIIKTLVENVKSLDNSYYVDNDKGSQERFFNKNSQDDAEFKKPRRYAKRRQLTNTKENCLSLNTFYVLSDNDRFDTADKVVDNALERKHNSRPVKRDNSKFTKKEVRENNNKTRTVY